MPLATHTAKDPSSKHTTTEYNRAERVSTRIRDLFSTCECFSLPIETFIERKKEIYASKDYSKLTSYYKGKMAGIHEVMWSNMYRYHLLAVTIGPDGRMFPIDEKLPGYHGWLSESSEYKSAMQCRHVWRRAFEKGEVRYW